MKLKKVRFHLCIYFFQPSTLFINVRITFKFIVGNGDTTVKKYPPEECGKKKKKIIKDRGRSRTAPDSIMFLCTQQEKTLQNRIIFSDDPFVDSFFHIPFFQYIFSFTNFFFFFYSLGISTRWIPHALAKSKGLSSP